MTGLPTVGQTLQGRYRIDRLLQQGGMSSVYLAFDTVLKARVAVKEMKGRFSSDEEQQEAVAQFRREAEMVAGLDHRGLPRVTNFFEEGSTCYLVMDFIDGESLERVCSRVGGVLPEQFVLIWTYEICQVLDYLHHLQPQVIFRDLKPSNVMLCRDGHIKLIDFGISKAVEGDGGTRTIIRGAGTPGYAPPEQYSSQRQRTDPRSDIYALGATMYTLLAYQVPTESTDRMMEQPLAPIFDYNPAVSPAVNAMIGRMMELRPDDRYATVREVMGELSTVMGGAPTLEALELPEGLRLPPAVKVDSGPATSATDVPGLGPRDTQDGKPAASALTGEPTQYPPTSPAAMPPGAVTMAAPAPSRMPRLAVGGVLLALVIGAAVVLHGGGTPVPGPSVSSAPATLAPVISPTASSVAVQSAVPAPTPTSTSTPTPAPKSTPAPTPVGPFRPLADRAGEVARIRAYLAAKEVNDRYKGEVDSALGHAVEDLQKASRSFKPGPHSQRLENEPALHSSRWSHPVVNIGIRDLLSVRIFLTQLQGHSPDVGRSVRDLDAALRALDKVRQIPVRRRH